MGPVFCLSWSPDNAGASEAVDRFDDELTRGGDWGVLMSLAGLRLFGQPDRSLDIRTVGSEKALVIGDVFDPDGARAPTELDMRSGPTPEAIAADMLRRYWGRYLMILRDAREQVVGVLRDPSGALDGLIWRQRGVTVIASEAPEILIRHFGPRQGLNWTALHDFLVDPIFGGASAPIMGMTTIAPGALATPSKNGFEIAQLWRPAAFAKAKSSTESETEKQLRHKIDLCVAVHASQPGTILGEISGGFDSAVIASALTKAAAPVAAWCNHYTEDVGGDERRYARTVAEQLGVTILERLRPAFTLFPERIAESQFGLRPSTFALDLAYEQETLDIACSCGASRLFTGIGGDGLFFVAPYPPVARDLYLSEGFKGVISPAFGDLARWCRKSVWSMAGIALKPHHAAPTSESAKWVTPTGRSQSLMCHPWRQDAGTLPPAKQRHIDEQILVQLTAATSLRGRKLDIVHPLLSQPIVEFCLGVPVHKLVAGGQDRALARRAFRGRLPDAILDRRSKGELGAYYSRAVSAAVPALRTFLLDGRLAQQGLLMKSDLEDVIDPAYLAQAGGFSALLFTAAIEAWARRWEPLTA